MGSARRDRAESARRHGQQRIADAAGEPEHRPRHAPAPASTQSQGATPLEREIPKGGILRRDLPGLEDGVRPEAEAGHRCVHSSGGVDVVRLAHE